MKYKKKHKSIGISSHTAIYLAKAKVRGLLLISMLDAVDGIIMTATDRIILGNMVGPEAVSATVLLAPVFMFTEVFSVLVAGGSSVIYTRAVGNYDDEESRRILGMASVMALIFGALMSVSMFAGGSLFFGLMGAEGAVLRYGTEYLYYFRFTFLIAPLLSVFNEILYIDGDGKRVFLSSLALVFGNAVLSFLLIPRMGVMGASLGSAIGQILAFLISLSHFMTKKYRKMPILSFDTRLLKEMIKIGSTDAIDSSCDCLYVFLMELFVVRMFGAGYLAVMAVTGFVYEMMEIGCGINDAMKTMLISFWGDRNNDALKSLMIYGIRITLMIGAVYIGLVWLVSPLLPHMYGIDGTELEAFAVMACRITSFSCIAAVFYGIFLDYYLNIGKYRLQILGNVLDSFLIRLPLAVVLGLIFGAGGIWIGESLCTYVCLAVLSFIVLARFGKDQFPFLIRDRGNYCMNISYKAEIKDVMDARDSVELFLRDTGIPKSTGNICMMLIEDMSLMIKEHNPEIDEIHIDTFINVSRDGIRVVIWSDGALMDLSDLDMIPDGMRAYIISSLLRGFDERKYQKTTGYNRASFIIPYVNPVSGKKSPKRMPKRARGA